MEHSSEWLLELRLAFLVKNFLPTCLPACLSSCLSVLPSQPLAAGCLQPSAAEAEEYTEVAGPGVLARKGEAHG